MTDAVERQDMMKKIINGKQDIDNELWITCKCGRCSSVWREPLDAEKMVIPRGSFPKILGYRSQCPQCRKKDVFLFAKNETEPLLNHLGLKKGDQE